MSDEMPENADSMDWTPGAMLRSAAQDADQNDADAAIVVMLDQKNGGYATAFRNAGLSASEAIALMEITKEDLIKRMGR